MEGQTVTRRFTEATISNATNQMKTFNYNQSTPTSSDPRSEALLVLNHLVEKLKSVPSELEKISSMGDDEYQNFFRDHQRFHDAIVDCRKEEHRMGTRYTMECTDSVSHLYAPKYTLLLH